MGTQVNLQFPLEGIQLIHSAVTGVYMHTCAYIHAYMWVGRQAGMHILIHMYICLSMHT